MKTIILKVDKQELLEWLYDDTDSITYLGREVFEALMNKGSYKKDINNILDFCGYIPFNLVEFPSEEIEEEFEKEFEELEFYDTDYKGEINGKKYEVKLI